MLRVALTGGIATGKSYVLDRLQARGVPCLDADALAHGVMAPGTEGSKAIAERFGLEFLDQTGAVDRQKLGALVFADPSARRDLEGIVHPAVYRAIAAGLFGFERLGSPLAVAAIPLLYETGHQSDFDKVIATMCSSVQQMERLRNRGLSDEEARKRISAQMPADEKAGRADFVVHTDHTFSDTDDQVDALLVRLLAPAN